MLRSLDGNSLCGVAPNGLGTFTLEGFTPLCEAFTKMPNLTSVRCTNNDSAIWPGIAPACFFSCSFFPTGLVLRSLNGNLLCVVDPNGLGTYTLEGFTPLCEAFTKMPNLASVRLLCLR